MLAEAGVGADKLTEAIEEKAEVPPGRWASLTGELISALHKPPWTSSR